MQSISRLELARILRAFLSSDDRALSLRPWPADLRGLSRTQRVTERFNFTQRGALQNQPTTPELPRTSIHHPHASFQEPIRSNSQTQREGRGGAHDRCWRGEKTTASRYSGCPGESPQGSGGPPPSPLSAGGLGQQGPAPCGATPAGSGRPIHKVPSCARHAAPRVSSPPSSGDRSWPGDASVAFAGFSDASAFPVGLRSR